MSLSAEEVLAVELSPGTGLSQHTGSDDQIGEEHGTSKDQECNDDTKQSDRNHSSHDETQTDEDDLQRFTAVLQALRSDRVGPVAVATRQRLADPGTKAIEATADSATVLSPPLTGSFNILLPIKFNDGTQWLLKIPSIGVKATWTQVAADTLRSEALVMQKLRRETTIPVPQVFDYDTSCDSPLGVPYILMEFVEGRSLFDVWFDFSVPQETVKARRTQALLDMAKAMFQLTKFTFEMGGSMQFDAKDEFCGIAAYRQVDNDAMLARLYEDIDDESFIWASYEPCKTTKQYFADRFRELPSRKANWQEKDAAILGLFLDWLPEGTVDDAQAFVLRHPDFNSQNVLVSDDGHVKALIDWDGVSIVPKSIGSKGYPNWLTRDWDPAMYGWKQGMDEKTEFVGCPEDSPQTLRYYRSVYARFMQSLEKHGVLDNQLEETAAEVMVPNSTTTRSLIIENLSYAVEDQLCRHGVLENLFDRIIDIICKDESDDSGASPMLAQEAGDEEGIDHEVVVEEDVGDGQSDHTEDEDSQDDGQSEVDEWSFWTIAGDLMKGDLDNDVKRKLKAGFDEILNSFH